MLPVPIIDVGDSSLRVPSLLSDEPTLELSGILSTNSVMIPVAPVALPMPENVSVVGESLIPLVDSNRMPTVGTLNLSDSVMSCHLCMRQSSNMRLVHHRLF